MCPVPSSHLVCGVQLFCSILSLYKRLGGSSQVLMPICLHVLSAHRLPADAKAGAQPGAAHVMCVHSHADKNRTAEKEACEPVTDQ